MSIWEKKLCLLTQEAEVSIDSLCRNIKWYITWERLIIGLLYGAIYWHSPKNATYLVLFIWICNEKWLKISNYNKRNATFLKFEAHFKRKLVLFSNPVVPELIVVEGVTNGSSHARCYEQQKNTTETIIIVIYIYAL